MSAGFWIKIKSILLPEPEPSYFSRCLHWSEEAYKKDQPKGFRLQHKQNLLFLWPPSMHYPKPLSGLLRMRRKLSDPENYIIHKLMVTIHRLFLFFNSQDSHLKASLLDIHNFGRKIFLVISALSFNLIVIQTCNYKSINDPFLSLHLLTCWEGALIHVSSANKHLFVFQFISIIFENWLSWLVWS